MLRTTVTLLALSCLLTACSNDEVSPSTPKIASSAKPVAKPVTIEPLAPSAPAPKVLVADQVQNRLLAKFDTDKDGRVSMREMLAHALDQQLKADRNADRMLNTEEFHIGMGDGTLKDPDITEAFKRIDANKDGQLDENELGRQAWTGIVHLDADQDGFLNGTEALVVPRH